MATVDDALKTETNRYSRLVLEYNSHFKRLVNEARKPGFSIEAWAPLADLVAVKDFVRVGSFKEVVNWNQYIGLIHGWAPRLTNWDSTFKRITAADRRVFLELEERSTMDGSTNVVNSLTVWEFSEAGKLIHLDIYLQQAMAEESAKGWEIAAV